MIFGKALLCNISNKSLRDCLSEPGYAASIYWPNTASQNVKPACLLIQYRFNLQKRLKFEICKQSTFLYALKAPCPLFEYCNQAVSCNQNHNIYTLSILTTSISWSNGQQALYTRKNSLKIKKSSVVDGIEHLPSENEKNICLFPKKWLVPTSTCSDRNKYLKNIYSTDSNTATMDHTAEGHFWVLNSSLAVFLLYIITMARLNHKEETHCFCSRRTQTQDFQGPFP